jgi:iron complex outermembrane receptor protein
MRFYLALFALAISCQVAMAQTTYTLSGQVMDESHHPLPGAVIQLDKGAFTTVSDRNGKFIFTGLLAKTYALEVSFLGYQTFADSVQPWNNKFTEIELKTKRQTLQEVIVTDHHAEILIREDSRSVEVVNDEYLKRNLSGSLMNSLDRLPGISSVTIGAGQSKPVIRGLGFNRVVVAENGIKHEGQQWGIDHGLEIDQYAAERIEVIKGPSSLMYGSDAIGGLINITQYKSPAANTLGGSMVLTGKTNNKSLGGSLNLYGRKENLFVTMRITGVDYADYRVPSDHVFIYDWKVPLHNNQVRNTAGNEYNIHLSSGYITGNFSTRFYYSLVNLNSGIFANAAGLEPLDADRALHDYSDRDILMPFQDVTHHKITNHSVIRMGKDKLELELGYQKNFRQEWMIYSPHGGMPQEFPGNLPFPETLEKEFDLKIYSGNIRYTFSDNKKFSLVTGINADHSQNRINGRGFLIPDYDRTLAGAFIISKYKTSEHGVFNSGIRYDYGNIVTHEYFDWYTTPVIDESGDTNDVILQRAGNISRNFNKVSWSLGYSYAKDPVQIKVNLGKSFRVPHAKELAANGFNAHMFRIEKGDSSLKAEEAYQFDIGLEWGSEKFAIGVSPFASYFPNYIYLNPTAKFDEALYKQVFAYTETEVFRYGGELHAHYSVTDFLKTGIIAEYIYSQQLSGSKKGFTLPFSPPPSVLLNVGLTGNDGKWLHAPFLSIDYKIVLEQNNVVPPEETTAGYQLINLRAGLKVFTGANHIHINAQVQNLLNTKYYNHASYYRIIGMPEMGINFILNVNVPFETQLKNKR